MQPDLHDIWHAFWATLDLYKPWNFLGVNYISRYVSTNFDSTLALTPFTPLDTCTSAYVFGYNCSLIIVIMYKL